MSDLFVWQPDEGGQRWLRAPGWEAYADLSEGRSDLLAGRREAWSGDGLVVWSEDEGYLGLAADPSALPEAAELLLEELDRFLEGELELRPTLLGGEPDYEPHDEVERYEEIRE